MTRSSKVIRPGELTARLLEHGELVAGDEMPALCREAMGDIRFEALTAWMGEHPGASLDDAIHGLPFLFSEVIGVMNQVAFFNNRALFASIVITEP